MPLRTYDIYDGEPPFTSLEGWLATHDWIRNLERDSYDSYHIDELKISDLAAALTWFADQRQALLASPHIMRLVIYLQGSTRPIDESSLVFEDLDATPPEFFLYPEDWRELFSTTQYAYRKVVTPLAYQHLPLVFEYQVSESYSGEYNRNIVVQVEGGIGAPLRPSAFNPVVDWLQEQLVPSAGSSQTKADTVWLSPEKVAIFSWNQMLAYLLLALPELSSFQRDHDGRLILEASYQKKLWCQEWGEPVYFDLIWYPTGHRWKPSGLPWPAGVAPVGLKAKLGRLQRTNRWWRLLKTTQLVIE